MKNIETTVVTLLLISVVIGLPFSIIVRDFVDCNRETYQKLSEIQKQYPKLQPFIEEKLEDNMLTWREWDSLKNKADKFEKQALVK
jgi:uncharacterized membrane protein (DUF106 family)